MTLVERSGSPPIPARAARQIPAVRMRNGVGNGVHDCLPLPTLNRALPGWAVDKIRFGVTGDHRRVWSALVSIAMSAHLRGWTATEYIREIAYPDNRLWTQMLVRSDGRRRRSDLAAIRELHRAWEQGIANANNVATRTLAEIRDDAIELAFRWVDRLVDLSDDDLSPTERSVMEYVISETERRGMLRVTCPAREVAQFAKVSRMTAHRTLTDLTRKGMLVKHSSGRQQGKHGGGRSAVYGLPDPDRMGHIHREVSLCPNLNHRLGWVRAAIWFRRRTGHSPIEASAQMHCRSVLALFAKGKAS